MVKKICIWLLLIITTVSTAVYAATPLQSVETNVNQLIAVLSGKDPAVASDAEKKKDAIRSISDALFDFVDLSRLTLGRAWKDFNEQQQKEFVALYRKLLEGIYMDRLLQYKDEKVNFIKESSLAENRSEVQSEVVTDTGNIPISYRLVLKGTEWKVYDLIIENVSLAKNYREQFASLLSKGSPESLLGTLREKVKNQSTP
jgi:phospholipid transport system substrate-binding protein